MRITLVSPKWNKLVNSYPPLGLGYLAAVAEAAGHTVRIVDLGLDPDTPLERGIESIVASQPDLVGVTAMTNNYHSAEQMMRLLKERLGCPIVVGGPHATIFPERVAAEPFVDYVIYGEGEETLLELLQAIAKEASPSEGTLRDIQGLCFATNEGVVCNTPRPLIDDLDALPYPARHLYELERYPLYAPSGEPMVTLLSSRGCPYNCSYCFKGIVGRTYRQRSAESVLGEIRHLVEHYGYRHIYFIDDLFTLDRERLAALTRGIIDQELDIRWQCLARVDRVTPELLELMYRSGCREVHYGIESGNAEILKQLGKGITHEQVRRAVRWTAEAGILAKGYFMLGLPGDTRETMQQTIELASELELDQAMFSLTTPFPGTRLWDEMVAQNSDVAFDGDFSQAYYYAQYDHLIKPFFNLSQVSDEELAQLAFEAQERFQEARRRHKYVRALGPTLGGAVYRVSTIETVRQIGKKLLRSGLFGRSHEVAGIGEYNAREEYASKWS
jgi:radical SAM superfamily enzyme YgiQ (UPF0313 family)